MYIYIYTYAYMHTYIHVYMCIYIYREREIPRHAAQHRACARLGEAAGGFSRRLGQLL